jgi:hypothetical protein
MPQGPFYFGSNRLNLFTATRRSTRNQIIAEQAGTRPHKPVSGKKRGSGRAASLFCTERHGALFSLGKKKMGSNRVRCAQ